MAAPVGVIHEDGGTVPGTHAIVIGIGAYPYLLGGKKFTSGADGMRQLSSPPLSARRFARWLLEDYNLPGKPLASLSLLVGEPNGKPFENPRTGQASRVGRADIATVLTGIEEWKARADSHPDNRLIFYFSGHGIGRSEDLALLAADFNGENANPLNQALDLRQLILGLNMCRATEQIYFIDACRSSSDTLLSDSGMHAGQVPFAPRTRPTDWPRRFVVPYYATLAGEQSHSIKNKVSLFTDALLRGLNGMGSDDPDGNWWVSTSRLQEAIYHFMTQPVLAGKLANVQYPTVKELAIFNLHRLKSLPVVPVYVSCQRPADNEHADFSCNRGALRRATRPARKVDPNDPTAAWMIELEFGDYGFEASVAGRIESKSVTVRPVFRTVALEAKNGN